MNILNELGIWMKYKENQSAVKVKIWFSNLAIWLWRNMCFLIKGMHARTEYLISNFTFDIKYSGGDRNI